MTSIVKIHHDETKPTVPLKLWEPEYIECLDHGFIGLIDFMGDDNRIVNSARVSYGRGTVAKSSDEGLIRYLMRRFHTTPFESVEFQFHVKTPIFVARQWLRHRTANVNEYSGRYSLMDFEMYVPDHEHTTGQSDNNKQGRVDGLLSPEDYKAVTAAINQSVDTAYQTYQYLNGPTTDDAGNVMVPSIPEELNNRRLIVEEAALAAIQQGRQQQLSRSTDDVAPITEDEVETIIQTWFEHADVHVASKEFKGIARELSRIVLPLTTYTQFYWKIDLHNLFHFLRLRADPHAQYEIRVYTDAMIKLIEPIVPMAMRAFNDYRLNGKSISRMESNLLSLARTGGIDISNDHDVEKYLVDQGCSPREVNDFMEQYNGRIQV